MNTQELKAEFCKTYFPTMLTFVNHCNIVDNDFALSFLNDALPKDAQRNYSWHLEGDDRIGEKDLMLGVEEFWALTEESFGKQRDYWVGKLLWFEGEWQELHLGIAIQVFNEILTHFGNIRSVDFFIINPSIQQFSICIELMALCNFNLIESKEDFTRNYYAFLIYTLIGLTSILRKEWNNNNPCLLTQYERPPLFQIPKQRLEVEIVWDDENSHMTKKSDSISKHLTFFMLVRKYDPFKIDVTYGQPNYLKSRVETEQTLSYYYWETSLNITIPSGYKNKPLIIKLKEIEKK